MLDIQLWTQQVRSSTGSSSGPKKPHTAGEPAFNVVANVCGVFVPVIPPGGARLVDDPVPELWDAPGGSAGCTVTATEEWAQVAEGRLWEVAWFET